MKKLFAKRKNDGFTLVELIIVIVIIGVLSAVLIPSLVSYVDKAKMSANYQEALEIKRVLDVAILEEVTVTVQLPGDETEEIVVESYEDFESVDIKAFYTEQTGETLSTDVTVDFDEGLLYYTNRGIQISLDLETLEYQSVSGE